MHLILLGAPGAGKGTQGSLLAERLEVIKISTGDMLRDALRRGTELGREAKRYMDAGELVPDGVILGLVRRALEEPESEGGAIFDGYPRNVAQAESLDALLSEYGRTLDAVVVIDVPEEALVRRLSGRRTDPETGKVYHVEHNPPPPEVAGRVVQRPDDSEETVRNRLRVFREATAPVIAYYEAHDVPVHRASGDRPIDEVQREILGFLSQ
jgi:adenylate kinase